jgi:hypothetical protein
MSEFTSRIVDPDSEYDPNLLTALRAAQARADAAEARVRELEDIRPNYTDEDYRRLNRAHCRTEERRAALEARVRELEEGLRPFAAIGADVSPVLADEPRIRRGERQSATSAASMLSSTSSPKQPPRRRSHQRDPLFLVLRRHRPLPA